MELGGAFNDAEVDARKGMAFDAVLAELNDAHEQTLRLAAAVGPERLREAGTLPWYGAEYAIDDLIVYQYYGHKREHGAQVDAFADHGVPVGHAAAVLTAATSGGPRPSLALRVRRFAARDAPHALMLQPDRWIATALGRGREAPGLPSPGSG